MTQIRPLTQPVSRRPGELGVDLRQAVRARRVGHVPDRASEHRLARHADDLGRRLGDPGERAAQVDLV